MDRVTFFFGGWEPIARIIVVGTLAYVALLLLQRVTGKRTLGKMNAFDFLITVALGASFGRILTARSVALAEAVTAFALLVALQFIVAALRVRSQRFDQAITAVPSLLFFRGDLQRAAMRDERVTEDELLGAARQSGFGSLGEVEAIVLEVDGSLAVIGTSRVGDGTALPEEGS